MDLGEPDRRQGLNTILSHSPPIPQPNLERLESRRRRSRKACEPCRQRKRKCDGHEPCKTCVEFEYNCYFAATKKRHHSSVRQQHDQIGSLSVSPVQQHHDDEEHHIGHPPLSTHEQEAQDTSNIDFLNLQWLRAGSAAAFPRVLGLNLGSGPIPKAHPYGYNVGARKENSLAIWSVADIISESDILALAKIYFKTVHPHLGFLDQADFYSNLEDRYNGRGERSYDEIICCVGALGSFFSGTKDGHPQETVLAEYAKSHMADAPDRGTCNQHLVESSLLRVVYLMCTSRPAAAWLASCHTMHLLEETGLHRCPPPTSSTQPSSRSLQVPDSRRQTAWMSFILHKVIAYGSGRSSVQISFNIPDPDLSNSASAFPHDLLKIIRALPSDVDIFESRPDQEVETFRTAFEQLLRAPSPMTICRLIKLDLVLATYRMIYVRRLNLPPRIISPMLAFCELALEALKSMIEEGPPWWMLASTAFHLVCVGIAVDTSESLLLSGDALGLLDNLTVRWNNSMTVKARDAAYQLRDAFIRRKQESIQALSRDLARSHDLEAHEDVHKLTEKSVAEESILTEQTFFEWPNLTFSWDVHRA